MQGADQVTVTGAGTSAARGGSQPAYEAKAAYAFATDAVTGKVWVSGISQEVKDIVTSTGHTTFRAEAYDIGGTVTAAGVSLTGYYFKGQGIGSRLQMSGGAAADGTRLDSDGGYIQATYVLPTATKIGLSYGESNMDGKTSATDSTSNMWTVGAYHPLTKHLNLVAEYSKEVHEVNNVNTADNKTVSLGAILFF